VVQPEPAGLRGGGEAVGGGDVRGKPVQRDGGRRRDHVRRGGRRVRQGHPPQAVAAVLVYVCPPRAASRAGEADTDSSQFGKESGGWSRWPRKKG
jgi:hypothetical protein